MSRPYPNAVRGPRPNSFFCAPYPEEPTRPSPQTRNTRISRPHVGSRRDVRVEYPPTHVLYREPTVATAPAAPAAPARSYVNGPPRVNDQPSQRGAEYTQERYRASDIHAEPEFRITWPTVVEFAFYFWSFSFMHYSIFTFWSKWTYYIYLGLVGLRVFLPVAITYRHSLWRAFKYFVVDLITSVVGPFLLILEIMLWVLLTWTRQIIALWLLICQHLAVLLVTLTVWVFTPLLDICFRISNAISGLVGSTAFWFFAVGAALTLSWAMEALINKHTVSYMRYSGVPGFAEIKIS